MKKLFVLTGISGIGKTTLIKYLIENHNFNLIRNFTTRLPRIDDFEYDFYEKNEVLNKNIAQLTMYDDKFYGVESESLKTQSHNNIMVGNPAADHSLREYLLKNDLDMEVISVYIRPDLNKKEILNELNCRLNQNNRINRANNFIKEQTEYDLYARKSSGKSIIITDLDTETQAKRLTGEIKTIFFGGKYDKRDDFIHDYRYRLTKGMCIQNKGSFEVEGTLLKYIGGFYFEEENVKDITHSNIDFIVQKEMDLILESDIFIAYLTDFVSTGTISELIYAASLGKEILIYYSAKKTKYNTNNPYWFATLLSKNLTPLIKAIPVKDVDDLLEKIREI